MKSFLQELAEKIIQQNPKLDEVTVVFPNRRAALYFRKHLSALLTKPVFSPALITIEDFIARYSKLHVPDKLELIHRLYFTYQHVTRGVDAAESPEEAEPFDRFYFWGEMLLRDFDEVDKYMVNADHIFKDLSHQKELDANFDFLTEEQQAFLKDFWSNFDDNQTANKKRFLQVWQRLPRVYNHFKEALSAEGLAYEGMLHREVAVKLTTQPPVPPGTRLVFAGFNALTAAEEMIISHFVAQHEAEVHWDMDEYYVNNIVQEAGRFFREYQQHPVLGKTFPADVPANLLTKKTPDNPIKLYGAAQPIGQAKLMAQVLQDALANGMNPEETLIVLPDEKLLLPVLHGISEKTEKLNVTMGFPLGSTPMFNLIELLIDLQTTRKNDLFNHRQVLAVLGHPYVVAADAVSPHGKRKEILKHNWVHIPQGFLATEVDLHRLIFQDPRDFSSSENITVCILHYLKAIVTEIGSLKAIGGLDKEYAFQFLKFFHQLEDLLKKSDDGKHAAAKGRKEFQAALKSLLRLLRQLVRAHKIPFSGEPLRGLQVMGVLETRNLDFKNVFMLSLSEGAFPSISSKGSYIPFNIRKAYKLPTVEHQDAMYAYLFYRALQRAENIYLFYNTETDVLGQGEMSRYLQQLLYESGLPVERKILYNPIQPEGIKPIVVHKNESVIEGLKKLNEGNRYFKGISPSALNSYIECRLRFYFRHIAKIKEPNEVEEELDARVLGNFLHDVMEHFYKEIRHEKNSKLIEEADFKNYTTRIDRLIDDVFIQSYRLEPGKAVEYEGQRLVVKEVVKRFAHRIVEMDKAYAPFTMEALEQDGLTYTVPVDHEPHEAVIGGKIDRVDRKDDLLRVIDYKTGKDKLDFESVASLFAREGNRNKAAFQTLLYALLYKHNFHNKPAAGVRLIPGLINRMNLFDEGFSFGLKVGKEQISDVEVLLPEFQARLKMMMDELFNPAQPFDQTTDIANCRNCPYAQLCYR